MCGIIGFTGFKNAIPVLLDGLTALEYRGYDSAGIAFFDDKKKINVIKSKGRLSCLNKKIADINKHLTSDCGIGHTRWATHGEPSDSNSHPHGTESVQIVHNGIIENFAQLRDYLISEKNYTFKSDTDTEVAACIIDYFYSKTKDPYDALNKATNVFQGSYGIAAIFKEYPNKIFAFRKDSPIIIAVSDFGNFIASDIPAVLKYTRKYYHIFEGEIAEITATSITICNSNKVPVERELQQADWNVESAEKGGYPHFMIKEINEESESLTNTLRPRIKNGMPCLGIDSLSDEKLNSFNKIHIIGCGTAMHAGLVGKYAIESLARVSVSVEIASEFRYKNPILNKRDLAIIISQSGETADTLAALKLAKQKGVFTLAIVNVSGSAIAREADAVLYTWAGPEIAVASTKAYTVQLAVLYLLTLRLAYAKGTLKEKEIKKFLDELLTDVPKAIRQATAVSDIYKRIANKYKHASDIFYIGRGLDYALAMEASLKLKEISYIHSEAYASGELKHGTLSLITQDTPVFALANDDTTFEKSISNIKEVKARGAKVILICRNKDKSKLPLDIADDLILVPDLSEPFEAFPISAICQLIAYHTSVLLGCDVDKPRNLAKSVTVE